MGIERLSVTSVVIGISSADKRSSRIMLKYGFKPRPVFSHMMVYAKKKGVVERLKKNDWFLMYGDTDNS